MHARVGKEPWASTGSRCGLYMPDEHALNDPSSAKVQPFGAHEKLDALHRPGAVPPRRAVSARTVTIWVAAERG
jgi:hypothetical protein